jgi:hypothetical protein
MELAILPASLAHNSVMQFSSIGFSTRGSIVHTWASQTFLSARFGLGSSLIKVLWEHRDQTSQLYKPVRNCDFIAGQWSLFYASGYQF